MNKALILYLFFYLALQKGFSQNKNFFQHLISLELYTEAEIHLRTQLNSSNSDSINYQLSYCKLLQNQTDSALFYLGKLNPNLINSKALLLKSQCLIQLSKEDSAKFLIQNTDTSLFPFEDKEILHMQTGGICLLQNNLPEFENKHLKSNPQYNQFKGKQDELNENFEKLKRIKKRSPLLAGVLSGIVPGLGKIYAGKTKQGVAAFVVTSLLATQSIEGYLKGGIKDPRFIIYGSIASVFYISNIYGSALSVNIGKAQTQEQIHNEVKVNLSVPIRYFFK
jgi:TM2 domain-containing membrane protein YozV